MLAMDNLSIGDRVGLNTSDEDAEEPSHLRVWQQSVQLPTHRDGEPKKELLKYMRVKDHDFAVQDNGEQAANAAKRTRKKSNWSMCCRICRPRKKSRKGASASPRRRY